MSIQRLTQIFEKSRESITEGVNVINTDHSFIHKGIAFVSEINIGALAAAASESYSFKTPVGKYLHFKNFKLSGVGASVKFEIMRGTTANPLVIDSAGDAASDVILRTFWYEETAGTS